MALDSQEHQQFVVDACTAAEPHHGQVWQVVLKDLPNVNKTTAQVIELVAKKLQ